MKNISELDATEKTIKISQIAINIMDRYMDKLKGDVR